MNEFEISEGYDSRDHWAYEQEIYLMWLDSEEGIEWANKWLLELNAQEVPSEYFEGVGA